MSNVIDTIMRTQLMSDLMSELNKDEKIELEKWVRTHLLPIHNLSIAIEDLSSTESSSERLLDAINDLFSSKSNKGDDECLEKS